MEAAVVSIQVCLKVRKLVWMQMLSMKRIMTMTIEAAAKVAVKRSKSTKMMQILPMMMMKMTRMKRMMRMIKRPRRTTRVSAIVFVATTMTVTMMAAETMMLMWSMMKWIWMVLGMSMNSVSVSDENGALSVLGLHWVSRVFSLSF